MMDVKFKRCNGDCGKCKWLNTKTDSKGYPYGYECTKYGNSVLRERFKGTKVFMG